MAILPLKLSGNLSERHKSLNNHVTNAFNKRVSFESIKYNTEHTPYDRLFKIDLASRYKNIDYILNSLKSYRMLFVNRALKSLWLLRNEHSNIINPEYLENTLYPEMHFKSVNKMKYWIAKNLKDEKRNEMFYLYYKDTDFQLAFKFLRKSNKEAILKLSEDILEKLNPNRLKILSQINVNVTKIFYESLKHNDKLQEIYRDNEKIYYHELIHILKVNPDLYLDIIEKYFNKREFKRLSFNASKFIMQHRKQRFISKPELYSAWFLDTKAIACYLNSDEIKDLIYRLAKAEYIDDWFSYKNVEPLLKNLNKDDRYCFKKEIFVDFVIKDKVKDWPYPCPKPLIPKSFNFDFYADKKPDDFYFPHRAYKQIKKRKYCRNTNKALQEYCCALKCKVPTKTMLDQLFDEYRFVSFEKTFGELRKRITTESNPNNRMFMLLVLVSKTGGHYDYLATLLKFLLEKHLNETNKFRAAIVRSLVKKAFVWRLPFESWQDFLTYAHGLGLDGINNDLLCKEGLHCVIIRKAIMQDSVNLSTRNLFIENFDTMHEYSLNSREKMKVFCFLRNMLLEAVKIENKPLEILEKLMQLLEKNHLRLEDCIKEKLIVITTIKRDPKHSKPLLETLYKSKVCRNELFSENFTVITNNDLYNYALKYNISVLDLNALQPFPDERFFKKLAIYFSEDLAPKFAHILETMRDNPETKVNVSKLARCLAIVSGKNIIKTIEKLSCGDENAKSFAKQLKANYHLAGFYYLHRNWSDVGVNAVIYAAVNCRESETKTFAFKLSQWQPTAAVAVRLALRNNADIIPQLLQEISKFGPKKVLPVGLECVKSTNPKVNNVASWEAVQHLVPKILDLDENSQKSLVEILVKGIENVPARIRASYCKTVYNTIKNTFRHMTGDLILAVVENNVSEEADDILFDAANHFYENEINLKIIENNDYRESCKIKMYIFIFTKFVLQSANASQQSNRFKNVLVPLLDFYKSAQEILKLKRNSYYRQLLGNFLLCLKSNKAFFDNSTIDLLFLQEKICYYLKSFLPVENHFRIYTHLQLTMLYYKTVKECMDKMPQVFEKDKKNSEGIILLGTIFGKYISYETKHMIEKYFLSIRELYNECLLEYLRDHFEKFGELYLLFVKSIVVSILDTDIEESYLAAEYLYANVLHYVDKRDVALYEKLKNCESKEVQFYLFQQCRESNNNCDF